MASNGGAHPHILAPEKDKPKKKGQAKPKKFKVPDNGHAISLPEFKPESGKKKGGTYYDSELLDYLKSMPAVGRSDFETVGGIVLDLNIDQVWNALFADSALLPYTTPRKKTVQKVR